MVKGKLPLKKSALTGGKKKKEEHSNPFPDHRRFIKMNFTP
jgi:hypothetical protein